MNTKKTEKNAKYNQANNLLFFIILIRKFKFKIIPWNQ